MHTDAALPDEPRSLDHGISALNREVPGNTDRPEETDDDASSSRSREGLPKTYRSRHDRHYVEQLSTASSMPLLRMLAVSRIDAANLPEPHDVTALTASVARLGVLQPLLVRTQDDRFVLISGRKRLVAAREARCREVPCLVHTADDERARDLADAANASTDERRERLRQTNELVLTRAECDALSDSVLPEIQHALSSVQKSLRLLPQSPAATSERVAMRLAAAELERAQWLVRCRRYLAGRLAVAPRATTIATLARGFRTAAIAIGLHGGQLAVDAAAEEAIVVDATLITSAIHGLAWAMLSLGESVGDPRVRVSLESAGAQGGVAIVVNQPTAVLGQQTLLRFFEVGWKARPGGAAAEIAVQIARYAAGRHGAELEVSSAAGPGTSVRLTLR